MASSSIEEYVQDTIARLERHDPDIRDSGLKIMNPSREGESDSDSESESEGEELRHFADTNIDTLSSDDIVKILDTARLYGPPITVLSLEYLELDSRVCMALLQLLHCDNRHWNRVKIRCCNGSRLEVNLIFFFPRGSVERQDLGLNAFPDLASFCLASCCLASCCLASCCVAMILASNPTNLSTLSVTKHVFGEDARALSQGLQMNTTLRTLDLSWSEFHDESLYLLSDGIARHPFLKELKFLNCELSDEECALVMNTISDHPSLQCVDFSSNFCGSRTMEATAACLQDNRMPNLKVLLFDNEDLSWLNELEPLPVGVLGASLKGNTTLQELVFQFCSFHTDELKEFMDGVRYSCVKDIGFFASGITNEQLEVIFSILPDCLKSLDIIAGAYSNETAGTLILDSLERHKHIDTLFMDETMPCWEKASYLLRLNRGGRFILSHELPLSLWPTILARVNAIFKPHYRERDSGYRQDVLYYFLREIAPYIGSTLAR